MQKILLIDKSANGNSLIEQTILSESIRLVPTDSPRSGVLKLGKEKFDLLISEFESSGGARHEIYKAFALYRENTAIPLVLLGGKPDDFLFLKEQEIALLHHLPKDATREQILELLQGVSQPKKTAGTGATASSINVDFLNPVLQATITTIGTMTDFSVTPGKPYLKKPSEVSGDISGIVNVVSEGFNGTISISFIEKTYLRVVSKMLMEDYQEINDENRSSVGELINIIFGQAKSVLSHKGHKFQPALPSIIAQPGHSVDHKSPFPPIAIDFSVADVGSLKVEICRSS